MARNEFRSKDKRKLPIFIQSELDDYGLTCVEFRTYARIARRAGGDSKATESVPNMAEAFGVDVSTVRRALKVLCLCGLVSKKDRPGWTPEYSLEEQDQWKDSSELKSIRESVLHPKGSSPTLVTTHRGKPEDGSHQTSGTLVTTPTTPWSPDIDEGTPVKVLPEGTPSARAGARGQELPRLPGSDEELDSKSPQYHYSKLKEPDFFGYDVVAEMTPMYPLLDVRKLFPQWVGSRIVQRGLGKSRPRPKSTIREYAQDFQNYLDACVSRQQNGNGNGHKPADDYRGPGRNTESDAARKKRESCTDCNGTNNRLVLVIDERTQKEIRVSTICKHENSSG